jgi:Cof subfamily protein (haloacid dehalogenase superfamily)
VTPSPRFYSTLALDLDGTLLGRDLRISPRCREAIRRAQECGVTVLLASARPPRSMVRYLRDLELATPLISYNGALVWDPDGGASLHHRPLPIEAARSLVAFLRRRDPLLNISLECANRWYIDAMTEEIRRAVEEYEVEPPHGVACLDQMLASGETVSKVLFRGDAALAAEIEAALPAELTRELHITTSGNFFCEVMCEGATKAAAITWTRERLCLNGGVVAIGDSPNDIPMLLAADLGVAMGNAAPSVIAAADVVTDANDADGVAVAIERWILGP